jgi:hypothetical protein
MSHNLNQLIQHAGAPENPQYIAPREIYLRGKMNTNTCLIGSSLVNNVNLLENARGWLIHESPTLGKLQGFLEA